MLCSSDTLWPLPFPSSQSESLLFTKQTIDFLFCLTTITWQKICKLYHMTDRNIASGSLFFHFQPVVFLIVLCYISFWTNNLSAWAEHDGDRFKSFLIAFLVCISVAKFTVAVWNPKISMKQVKRKMKSYLKYFAVSYVQDFWQKPNSS